MLGLATSPFTAVLGGGGWFNEDSAVLLERGALLCGSTPRLLVMPTPLSSLPCGELDGIRHRFGSWDPEFLTEDTQAMPDPSRAEELIEWANIILVMGGNFGENMKRWRETGIDQMLLTASERGKVFVGSSNGLNCWFKAGQTLDRPLDEPKATEYFLQPGLGVLPALVCAHYDNFQPATGVPRSVSFTAMMRQQPVGTVGIGVTNFGYIELSDGTVTVNRTRRYAGVHRLERTPFQDEPELQMLVPGAEASFQEFFSPS